MRILFTGGSGKAGRHVIPYLMDQGHQVLNVDQQPLDHPGVDNRIADITDAGQMHDVMHSLMNLGELDEGTGVQGFDAIVHFAAVPRILITSDTEVFRVNTLGTYHVIDAAVKAGVPKIIFASSETTYGICFAQGSGSPTISPSMKITRPCPKTAMPCPRSVTRRRREAFRRARGRISTG